MFNPKVTVIIPVYNHSKFVEQCVHSVYAQTYKNIEVFCMDNESKDNSYEIIKKLKEKYPSMTIDNVPYIYPYCWDEVRDASFKLMTGEYFMIISADDYLHPDYIKNNIEIFAKAPNKILMLQSHLMGVHNGKEVGELSHFYKNLEDMKEKLLERSVVNTPSVFYNRKIYDYGLIDVDPIEYSGAGDYEFWCRLADKGYMVYPVPKWLGYYYRWHENQATWAMQKSNIKHDERIKTYWKNKWRAH